MSGSFTYNHKGGLGLWYLTLFSTIFQLYPDSQFYWCTRRKPPTCRKNTQTEWTLNTCDIILHRFIKNTKISDTYK